jgi:hypothetical protein
MKKIYRALGAVGAIIVILILLHGAGEHSVSNFYIIPAGTFSLIHELNPIPDQTAMGNTVQSELKIPYGNNLTINSSNPGEFQKIVFIESLSPQSAEGTINLSGSAILPGGSGLLYEIWPGTIDARKSSDGTIDGISGLVYVHDGAASGTWSVDLDLTAWKPGKYIIIVWPVDQSDPWYGDKKVFFLPLNDTLNQGAGRLSGTGELLLNEPASSDIVDFVPPAHISKITMTKDG